MTREDFRQEKEKLKKMSSKDRTWYIWNYYRVQILVLLAALFVLFEAAGAFMRSRQDCMLYCAFINQTYAGENQLDRLKEVFYIREGFSGRQVLTFDTSINMSDDQLYSDASSIVFQSLIGTDTVDIVITSPEIFEQFLNLNVFLNLEDALSPELISRLGDHLCYTEKPESGSADTPVPTGISLKDSSLPSAYGLDEDSILAVCSLSHHPEVITDFITFIFP